MVLEFVLEKRQKKDVTNSTQKLFKGQQTPISAKQIKIEREREGNADLLMSLRLSTGDFSIDKFSKPMEIGLHLTHNTTFDSYFRL